MNDQTAAKRNTEILRLLPSVDRILNTATARRIANETGAKHTTELARTALKTLRETLSEENSDGASDRKISREILLAKAEENLESLYKHENSFALQPVINATGVVIHTNLGRAPLSENAKRAIVETASAYCTLEYDLETGKRGRRGRRAEELLAEITGAESALIVNNCAAAAFFVLTALARGGEVIISRGELVEIGGDFRVPDVMEQSGAGLKEVGTTNRTKISDYEKAVGENTRMILRVHPSNYRIVGFTATPELAELVKLAHERDLIFYEDAGSGAIFDLSEYGLSGEPVVTNSIKAGADVITFSGDKLLGGVQAGLIVGKTDVIEKLRKHPLYRALRVDKLTYAALEATLRAFQRETVFTEIPVLKMLAMTAEELKTRVEKFTQSWRENLTKDSSLQFEVIAGNSVIGGGSAPMVQPETTLLSLRHEMLSAAELEAKLRGANPPVVTRILEDKVLIDLRTVSESEETELLKILTAREF